MAPESDLPREPPGVFYPVSDDAGQSGFQSVVIHLLLDLLEDYFVFVGANQFLYYKQGDPRSVVAPDVYATPDLPFQTGHLPRPT
ncbi:hypothetical protein OV203_27295 [Nannocystis sp. ILAH1]|uniref:hypothetical protein n=1 Tax=Nannocystis sp. ILAH1 TaxID=2996789 RepID=UPI00226F3A2B|nr:hypothetical protein [Nannocystis sp. ILAH1]MCY0990880.1 hypothetical protein [Nannocystis sp. ILAH1]